MALYFLTEFLSQYLELGLILEWIPLIAVSIAVLILVAWIVQNTKTPKTPVGF